MGIPHGTARLLLDEHRQRPFSGTVLQFGRSSVHVTLEQMRQWAPRHGVELAEVDPIELSHDPRLARQDCLADTTFFHLLGFDRVEASDISDWEGAEHILDLNAPVPESVHGRFDVVLDPGTSLQIFHQPNLLENIFKMLKVGGRVIHAAVPSNNHMDLGFYMLSPTFYDDFFRANGWRIESHFLCQYYPYWHQGRLFSAPWKIYRYEPGCLDHLNYGRFGGRQVAIFFVATKLAESTGHMVPQLGQFVRSWQEFEKHRDEPDAVAGELPGQRPERGFAAWLDHFLAAHPTLRRAYRPIKRVKERIRRTLPQKMPPLVARY